MRDINTYIEEGFYRTVGADFVLHRENFEKLKSRIYNYTGGVKKMLPWNDRTRRIAFISNFSKLPEGTSITLPLPAIDYDGPRGKRYECTLTKISNSTREDDMLGSKWNSDIDEIGWHKTGFNDLGILTLISRAENFLKKEELNNIKIDFSIQ